MSNTSPEPGPLPEPVEGLEDERPPHAGPWSQLGASVVTGVIGVAGIVGSLQFGLGELTAPGPGMWPFAISVLITVLSVVLAVIGRRATDTEMFSRSSLQVAIAVATLILLALAMPVIGFEIPALALTFVWLRFLGKESWKSSISISIGTVAAFYVIFVLLLQIPLPRLL